MRKNFLIVFLALVLTVVSFSLPFAEIHDSGFFDVMTFWVVVMALFIYLFIKEIDIYSCLFMHLFSF